MAKKEGAYELLTQLPVLYLILRAGAGVDVGVGQTMEFGIFDFFKVFSRVFGEGVMGRAGNRRCSVRISPDAGC